MIDRATGLHPSIRVRVAAAAAASAALLGTAWAQPGFSGPSVTKPARAVTLRGTELPANAALTVMVTAPDGSSAGYGVVTTASGRLVYQFTPSQTGRYTVTLTDSGGRQLASAPIAVLP